MLTWITRLLLILFLLMPIAAIGLMVVTVQQIQADIAPVIDGATQSINTASAALQLEVSALSSNFQPLADVVNGLRSALSAISSFISDAVNAAISAVNALPFVEDIQPFRGVAIPALVDLSFIDRISANITEITEEVNSVTSVVSSTVSMRLQMLLLAFVLVVAWMMLGFLLLALTMFRTLWGGSAPRVLERQSEG